MATLLLATGVPMVTAGDELGRTQGGNNNAYCQDTDVSWVHWDTQPGWSDLSGLTRALLTLRAQHPALRPAVLTPQDIRDAAGQPTGRRTVAWFGGGPRELTSEEWHDHGRRTLGKYVADPDRDVAFLVWFHSGADPVEVELPGEPWAMVYTMVAHTGVDGELSSDAVPAGARLAIPGRTVVVLAVT